MNTRLGLFSTYSESVELSMTSTQKHPSEEILQLFHKTLQLCFYTTLKVFVTIFRLKINHN